MRVIVVEDNQSLAENLAEILTGEDFDTVCVHRSDSALEMARSGFDVAVVDVHLADGAGATLVSELKSIRPEAEVIVISASSELDLAHQGVLEGAFALFVKPIRPEMLSLAVKRAAEGVSQRARTRELAESLEASERKIRDLIEIERRAAAAGKLAAAGTLAAGVAHEIRNPLNAASLQLEVLTRVTRKLPAEYGEKVAEPLASVRAELCRIEDLITDFMRFAQARAYSFARIDLTEVVDQVLDLELELEIESSGGDDASEPPEIYWTRPPPVEVQGDSEALEQMLANVLRNAVEAARSRVDVDIELAGGAAVIVVRDDGPGISPEVRARLFEPFFTTKPSGTGLGLPIALAIANAHQGHIDVVSNPGKGAEIRVSLPLPTRPT